VRAHRLLVYVSTRCLTIGVPLASASYRALEGLLFGDDHIWGLEGSLPFVDDHICALEDLLFGDDADENMRRLLYIIIRREQVEVKKVLF
jgi:hypothetical protein